MTSALPALCDACGEPMTDSLRTGGHCSRCLFQITFSDLETLPDAEVESMPWTRLSGCELYEEIGRGGMGVVYRAKQKALNRVVAVKVLLRAPFASSEERERFQREAQAAARLKHPGIVGIFEVGEDEGVPWFSMEHIPGQSLEQAVREHPMESRAAAHCVRAVADALQHAHEHGVLHRDLKPSNILLDEQGEPRITDFGIARMATSGTTHRETAELTRTGQMLGSPGYAAPEQALQGRAEVRTDVYGLGALLYHLLTGRPPFQGPTLDAIVVQLRENEPLSPRQLTPGVPKDLETICLKCLHKLPEGRYASAAAVAEDLARFLEGQTILARPPSALGKAWRWMRRYPAIAAMLSIIALLVIGLIAGGILFVQAQTRMEHRAFLLSEARTLRQTRLAGSRDEALSKLRQAWSISPSLEIRNEAIACLALPEMAEPRVLNGIPTPDSSRSADGQCVAVFEGDQILIREVQTGRVKHRLSGHPRSSLMKLDDQATRLAIAAPGSGDLKLIRLADQQLLATCHHPLPLSSVDWSGELIATGCENHFIYIWDDQGSLKHRLSGHEADPVRLAFRPGSQELCSATQDRYVRLWHAARGQELLRSEAEHALISALWWTDDGRQLRAGLGEGKALAFDISPSPCLKLLAPPQEEPHTENLGSADVSFDGRLGVAIDERQARVWDFEQGRVIARFAKAPDQWLSALFSPGSHQLWVCGWSEPLAAHDLLQGHPVTQPMFGYGNLLRQISRDGKTVVLSNNALGEFIIGRTEAPTKKRLKHPGNLAAALSPNGRWAVTSSYQQPGARIWSLPAGKPQRMLCPGDIVMQAVITPDGERLILQTGGLNRVFRTRDWTEERTLPPKLRLNGMTLSPDGQLLATIGDNHVHLLSTEHFEELGRLRFPDHVGWLGDAHPVFSAEGRHLMIHTALGSMLRWDLHEMHEQLHRLGMPFPKP